MTEIKEDEGRQPCQSRFGLSVRITLVLRPAGLVTPLEIVLILSNPLAALNPARTIRLLALFGQLVQSWPVACMVISELDVTSHGLHQMVRGNVLAEILVELHFFAGDGVDERSDQLEEAPDHERHCVSPSA